MQHTQKEKLEMRVDGWWLVVGGWNAKLTKPGLPKVWTSFALVQQRFSIATRLISICLRQSRDKL